MSRIRSRWSVAEANRHLLLIVMVALVTVGAAGTLTVTTEYDELDLSSEPGTCSLREAIISSNEGEDIGGCRAVGSYGEDVIEVPAGVFEAWRLGFFQLLTKPDQQELDFDVYGSLTIRGQGTGTTVISGATVGRAVQVHAGAELKLVDVTVRDGVAPTGFLMDPPDFAGGGGILNEGRLTLQRVDVRANTAETSGGGVYNASGGHLTVIDSTIQRNAAHEEGGGAIFNAGTMALERSTLSDNAAYAAADFGGGGLLSNGTSRLENVTISGNAAATRGGGISVRDGVAILSSTTVVRNRANRGGGAFVSAAADLRMESTLLASNGARGDAAQDPDCRGAADSFGHNLIGVADGCSGFGGDGDLLGSEAEPLLPRLEVLELRGGPTATHALLAGSPARDRGPLQGDEACLPIDQRGEPRPRDGDGDGLATRCDIGAFEAADAPTTADLAVRLESGPDTVTPGAGVAFLVVVHNQGPALARDVHVAVTLDEGVTQPELPSGTCAPLGQSFTCPLGDLSAGGTTGLAFELLAPDATGTMETAAAASHDGDDPTADDDRREVTTTVRAVAADLSLAQSLSEATLDPFGTAFVEVEVANAGPDAASDVQMLVEAVADADTGASASFIHFGGCTPGATAMQALCPLGTLSPGAARSATLTLQAHATEGMVTIRSTVAADEADPDGEDPELTTALIVGTSDEPIEGADVRLVMSGPAGVTSDDAVAEVPPGTPFALRFDVTNAGPEELSSAQFAYTLAEGVTVEAVPGNCVLATDPGGNDVVNCSIIRLASGEGQSFAIDVQAPSALGAFTSTASIFNGTPADPETGNNFAFLVMRVRGEAADLALTVTAPESAVPGARLNVRLEVRNAGPDAARDVVVTGSAPEGARFLSGSSGCELLADQATCALGTLAAGAAADVTLEASAPEERGVYEAIFTSSAATEDPVPDDDAVAATFRVEPFAIGSDLALDMDGPISTESGEAVSYAIEVANVGPDAAAGVVVRAALPEAATVETLPAACAVEADIAECALGSLAAGSTHALELAIRSRLGTGTLVTNATASTTEFDPNPDNDHASVVTQIVPPGAAPNLDVSTGPSAPADATVARGTDAVPALQAQLDARHELEVSAIGLRASGTGDDAADLERVRVYLDADANGRVSEADALLAEGTFAEDDGVLHLTFEEPRALAASASEVLLVAVDVASPDGASGAAVAILALALLPFVRAGRRRGRWAVTATLVAMLLVACGTGAPGGDEEVDGGSTHRLTLESFAGTAESGPVVAEGLPLEGTLLRLE